MDHRIRSPDGMDRGSSALNETPEDQRGDRRTRLLCMISSMRGGGSEQQTLLLLRHLDRSRFEIHLYLSEAAGDLLPEVPDDVVIHTGPSGHHDSRVYIPGQAHRAQVQHLSRLIEREQIDAIYDRTFQMTLVAGPAVTLTKKANRRELRQVSTIVSPPSRALPLVEKRFVWLKKQKLTASYRASDYVVAVSRQAADSAAAYYGIARESIRVIHNPVDVDRLKSASDGCIEKPEDRLTLCCVGRMTAEKGQLCLVKTLQQLEDDGGVPPITLWMIGDGPLRSEIDQAATLRLKRHQVKFLGHQAVPAPFIRAADGLVLPSHFEGMPNVVLEAMALGTPVIATKAGGTVELQRDRPTMFLAEPGDAGSLADAIGQFVSSVDLRTTHVTNALEMIHQFHHAESTTREIESLLAKNPG